MWFFGGKDKGKAAKSGTESSAASAAANLKEQKTKELMAIMRATRAEIGEENLQAIVRKMKLDDLKKQVRNDIDTNPHKLERLLDAIRFEMHDDKP